MKKKILVSACLLGEPVRYDGGSKPFFHPLLESWKEEGRVVPVCPECLGGLKIPREPSEQRAGRVYSRSGCDVTAEYELGAERTLELAIKEAVAFALLKEKSPSCGSRLVHDGSFEGGLVSGQGITAAKLRAAGISVFSEEEIEDISS